MTLLQRAVQIGGLAVAAVTLLVATRPGLGGAVPVDDAVAALGGDLVFVALFGALAVAFLLIALAWRGVRGLNQAAPPDPESVQSVPLFGRDFDDEIDGSVGLRTRLFSDRPDALRERLRAAAIEAETASRGCSRASARERVLDGTWTDDRTAAAFLSDDAGPRPSITDRARAALHGKAWFQRGARRAAERVVERTGEASS